MGRLALLFLDKVRLSNVTYAAMPIIKAVQSDAKIKVAVVFEPPGGIRPAWFEIAGKERVQVSEICATWHSAHGAAKIIVFEIWDRKEKYSLRFDTQALTWSVGLTVIE